MRRDSRTGLRKRSFPSLPVRICHHHTASFLTDLLRNDTLTGAFDIQELDQDQLPSVLDGLLSKEKHVRQSSLQAFQVVPDVKSATIEPLPYVVARLWHAMFDKDEENAKLAKQLWEHTGFQLVESQALWAAFYSVLSSPVEQIRVQAGRAISAALAELPSATVRVLRDLFALYTRNVRRHTSPFNSYSQALPLTSGLQ